MLDRERRDRSSAPCSQATAPGRASDDEITIFDSTGLAIQDLAIALAAWSAPTSSNRRRSQL